MSALRRLLFAPHEHASPECMRSALRSDANGVTLLRAAVVVALFALAMAERSHLLVVAVLAASIVGDVADGALARRQDRLSVFGAQVDHLVDRLAALCVLVGMVVLSESQQQTQTAVAAVGVWLHYGIVDPWLSMQFVQFGLWSQDEFHRVSWRTWMLNWSGIAKLASGLPIVLFAFGGPAVWAATGISLVLAATRFALYVPEHMRIYARADRLRPAEALTSERPPTTRRERNALASATMT